MSCEGDPKRMLTEIELVRQLQQGDRKAFGDLYELYRNKVYTYCTRMLADGEAAGDVTHETFLKAQSRIEQLHDSGSFKSWLFAIAHHEVLMDFRRRRTNIELSHAEGIWDNETPLDMAVSNEISEIVQRMLQKLKPEYRAVLLLREFEQLSYTQIAAVTGTTESSVKSRIFKARKALVEKLKPYFQQRGEI